MEEERLPVGFARSSKLHVVVTFLAILEIFDVSDASLFFYVLCILDIFVAWNSPPSPVVLHLGLWAALGVGASYS